MRIIFGLDIDKDASASFKLNFPGVVFVEDDIKSFPRDTLDRAFQLTKGATFFCGCSPCQPFSKQNRLQNDSDPRRGLLHEFGLIVTKYLPDYIFVENVPGMQKASLNKDPFVKKVKRLGYYCDYAVLPTLLFGVPQTRARLVFIASKYAEIKLPIPTHGQGKLPFSTVSDWISDLPPIAAGDCHPDDPIHCATKLSELNLKRIKATPEGGGREDWPSHLLLHVINIIEDTQTSMVAWGGINQLLA